MEAIGKIHPIFKYSRFSAERQVQLSPGKWDLNNTAQIPLYRNEITDEYAYSLYSI